VIGKIIGRQDKPARGNIRDPGGARPGSLADLRKEGHVPYLLGPIYAYVGVREDIEARYAGENIKGPPEETYGRRFGFRHQVVTHCGAWSCVLNSMEAVAYKWFRQWLIHQNFICREQGRFYVPRSNSAPVLDPFALERGLSVPESLDVWTVSGMKGRLGVEGGLKDPSKVRSAVHLVRLEPEADVVSLGRNLLDMGNFR
jgi:hypothetical protein